MSVSRSPTQCPDVVGVLVPGTAWACDGSAMSKTSWPARVLVRSAAQTDGDHPRVRVALIGEDASQPELRIIPGPSRSGVSAGRSLAVVLVGGGVDALNRAALSSSASGGAADARTGSIEGAPQLLPRGRGTYSACSVQPQRALRGNNNARGRGVVTTAVGHATSR
jgi:hypothetical protein